MGLSGTAITEVDAFTAQVFPPAVGTFVLAEDVLALAQVTANRTKNLSLHKLNKDMQTGETLDVESGAIVTVHAGGTVNFNTSSILNLGGTVAVAGGNNFTFGNCTVIHNGEIDLHFAGATRLTWGSTTLDSTSNQRVVLGAVSPAASNITITLRDSTSNIPPDGTWFEINIAGSSTIAGQTVTIVRQTPSGGGAKVAVLTIAALGGSTRDMSSIRVVKDHALGAWVVESTGFGAWAIGADGF